MPVLDYAFLADFARSKNGSLDALSIGIDVIALHNLPGSAQVVLVARLNFDRIDCETTHRIETIVQDPDGGRPIEVHVNAQAAWPAEEATESYIHVEILMPLLLPVSNVGPHSVELSIDGRHLKTITFTIVKFEAPGGI